MSRLIQIGFRTPIERFSRNVVRIKRTGRDMSRLAQAIDLLAEGKPMPPNNRDHPLVGNFKILLYWLMALSLCLDLTRADESNMEAPRRTARSAQVTEAAPEFRFEKNTPRYFFADPKLFDEIRKLALTKPAFDPGTGLSDIESVWAHIHVKRGKGDALEITRYVLSLSNQRTRGQDDSPMYKIGMFFLSEETMRDGISVTRGIGYYDTPRLLNQLIDLVCHRASSGRPKTISKEQQVAPSTAAEYGDSEDADFKKIGDLAKHAKPSVTPIRQMPVAVVRAAPPLHIVLHKEEYHVEIFEIPGLMRISEGRGERDRGMKLKTLGFVSDKEVWLMLCNKFGASKQSKDG